MNDDGWIEIVDWERFQHYRDRNPVWIKNYVELLHKPEYLSLSETQRATLHGLWLMYAVSHRKVVGNTAVISRQLNIRVTKRTLAALNHAGFIRFLASEPLASRYHDAMPEGEREGEREGPLTPQAGNDFASRNDIIKDLDDGLHIECAQCGEPVHRGRVCPHCGANPRLAGTNPRAAKRPKDPFKLAEAMTRNAGWQYELPAFRDELDRFDLTDDERTRLIALRSEIEQRVTIVTATEDNPFL